jgi:hypothetical protein
MLSLFLDSLIVSFERMIMETVGDGRIFFFAVVVLKVQIRNISINVTNKLLG